MAKERSRHLGFFARWFSENILPNKTFPNCLEADHSLIEEVTLTSNRPPESRSTQDQPPVQWRGAAALRGRKPEDVSEESFIAVT